MPVQRDHCMDRIVKDGHELWKTGFARGRLLPGHTSLGSIPCMSLAGSQHSQSAATSASLVPTLGHAWPWGRRRIGVCKPEEAAL